MTQEALTELRERWTGSRERLARMLSAMDLNMRRKHGHGLPPEVMALGNVFYPEPVVMGLLDERDRLAARVLDLEAPGECQSLHKLRADRDELAAEVAAYQGRPEGALPGWTTYAPTGAYRRAGLGEAWLYVMRSGSWSALANPHASRGERREGFEKTPRAAMRVAEAAARSRGWL